MVAVQRAVLDPWLTLVALALTLAGAPALPKVLADPLRAPNNAMPGVSARCPSDMRLVVGTHHDDMAHLCSDARDEAGASHCYRYHEGFSILEGPITEIDVCMDEYEAPNKRGARPMVLQSYDGAVKWCSKLGKRLCSEQEWELGCEGPERRPWAYGWAVDTKLCNSGKGWRAVDFAAFGKTRDEAKAESDRLWQGSLSGRYKTCVSPFGVVDMMGNVEEWVTSRPTRKHGGALMGGFWAKPWTGCRGTNDAHGTNFAFYETGFRCCKAPTEG
jgi:hypothetical protein